jgi:hypothetical protein
MAHRSSVAERLRRFRIIERPTQPVCRHRTERVLRLGIAVGCERREQLARYHVVAAVIGLPGFVDGTGPGRLVFQRRGLVDGLRHRDIAARQPCGQHQRRCQKERAAEPPDAID